MKWEWRGYTYNNESVKNNLPTMVEVDFDGSTRTDFKHWVLFIGNQQLMDPWTGTIDPTTKYRIKTGYAIITGDKKEEEIMSDMYKGIDLSNRDSVKVAVDIWSKLAHDNMVLVDKDAMEKRKTLMEDLVKQNGTLAGDVSACQISKGETEKELEVLEKVVDNMEEANDGEEVVLNDALKIINMIKQTGKEGFQIPEQAWDNKSSFLGALTKLTSGGNIENHATFDILAILVTRFKKFVDKFIKGK